MAASPMPAASFFNSPVQAREMDKEDIRNLRRAHRAAALRAKAAGFDLVYVYAGHGLGIFQQFLSRATNFRSDEYGGSLENRARFLREVIEDTKDAVGGSCAVPVRIAMNEFQGSAGLETAEVEDAIAMMAELPDLWDLSLSSWSKDSQTSRFAEEGFQEPYIKGVKKLTSKPVVGVGRYTSPDSMVRVIRQGIMDMIGAARPSIADPFLPEKDRGRPPRRHPRMHRLQHLHHQRLHHDAAPLHAESHHGRGVAARLASGKDPSEAEGCTCPRGRRRSCGPRGGARPGSARADRSRSPTRRPKRVAAWPASAGCQVSPPGAGFVTGGCCRSARCRMSRSTSKAT